MLAIRRRVLGPEHPDTLTSMNNLAETLRAQGDLAGARKLQEETLAICRRVLGPEHPDTLTSMNNLAMTLRAQGDLAGARKLQEETLAHPPPGAGAGAPGYAQLDEQPGDDAAARRAIWRGRASCRKRRSPSAAGCWGRSTRIRSPR